jgi:RNA polymerase sigma factor (TIGR02999 family)
LSISAPSAEITGLLKAWSGGDQAALARLAERVYPELRLMARQYMRNERQAHTLQATGLVHEVYLRLIDMTKVEWRERAQFLAMAAPMMRRILVDAARARGAQKRGGDAVRVNLDETALLSSAPNRSILALDEALTAFSNVAPRQAKVVELRYFRWIDRGGNRRRFEDLAAHGQARLGSRQGMVIKGVRPSEIREPTGWCNEPRSLPAN